MTPMPDSPQIRLAASRKALSRYMERHDGRGDNITSDTLPDSGGTQGPDAHPNKGRSSTWHILTQGLLAWWQHHPLQIAVDIGRPFLNNYARDKPVQMLGIAAGIGAAAILVKPWRLISVTGLVVAALKSTRLSTTLLSLLPRAAGHSDSRQTQPTSKDISRAMRKTT